MSVDIQSQGQERHPFSDPIVEIFDPSTTEVITSVVIDQGHPDMPRVREIEIAGGRNLYLFSYFDGHPGMDDLTEMADSVRDAEYERTLWRPGATAEPIRGDNIELLALFDPTAERLAASVRKWHLRDGEGLPSSPSYKKFQDASTFDDDQLQEFHAAADGRPVVDIVGLSKDPGYSSDGKLALYRQAIQDSIERDEIWFLGVVEKEYSSLVRTYGDRVIQRIGEPTPVNDGAAKDSLRIVPVVVDPSRYFDNMIDEVVEAREKRDYGLMSNREFMLWYFLEGFDQSLLSEQTTDRLRMEI